MASATNRSQSVQALLGDVHQNGLGRSDGEPCVSGQPFVPKQRHVFVGVDDGLKVGKRAHGHAHKLNVQRAVFRGGQGGLFDRFCEGGVGVAHA